MATLTEKVEAVTLGAEFGVTHLHHLGFQFYLSEEEDQMQIFLEPHNQKQCQWHI
jgi:hypothetical protein